MGFRSALAVFAHPDDESFGLGAVLAHLVAQGTPTGALCFTRGEASTLGKADDLGTLRAAELAAAGAVLGLASTAVLDYPDGGLAEQPLSELAAHVEAHATAAGADLLVVFDEAGITGHPDHCRATAAALIAADRLDLAVLAWALPDAAARRLNVEFGTGFVGRLDHEIDLVLDVDRRPQLKAIRCHASQSIDNPVLWARLAMLEQRETLRWLRRPPAPVGWTFGPGRATADAGV
ncbi:MAG TPA: PIG-L deacetylase family protein [Acidimicrobiales bacterium]|nr:PIG-L deacetylase family protein [Acidimicrobiales bacterium]